MEAISQEGYWYTRKSTKESNQNDTKTTLEIRRLRGDQIEVFKILNEYENIDRNIFVLG